MGGDSGHRALPYLYANYWRRHKSYPRWCKPPPPRPSPSPSPSLPTDGGGYMSYMLEGTRNHWKNSVRNNMYPRTYALQQGRDDLSLFSGDHGTFSLAALPRQPSPAALVGKLKPATDDMVKAGWKAAGTTTSQLGKFIIDCIGKEPCAKEMGSAIKFLGGLVKSMPKLLNVGFPLLGVVLNVLVSLFWPDTAGPPPLTIEQVKDEIDKKVLEAADKLGRQLLASIALYTDATIGKAIANIEIETAVKALSQNSAFMSGLDELNQGLDVCAEFNAAGNCTLLNQQVFTSLGNLVSNVIPDTLEKIFPSNDPDIKDYAAARRIPYLVAFGQLALPFMFQWAWMADGLSAIPAVKPPNTNYRLNAQLRKTLVALSDAIDTAIVQSIARRTDEDMRFWTFDGSTAGKTVPFECGFGGANKALQWCLTDAYPNGGGENELMVAPFQGIDEVNDPHHRFLMFRRIGMVQYAQSVRWGTTTPLLYASLVGASAPARTWALWGTDLRQNASANANARAAVTPVFKVKVAHVGPVGGSCTFQGLPWWKEPEQGCTPSLKFGPNAGNNCNPAEEADEDLPYYLCLQCANSICKKKYNTMCDASSWCGRGNCHVGNSFAEYLGNRDESTACNGPLDLKALEADCKSKARRDWVLNGCDTPDHRRSEMKTDGWTRYRKCYMPTPPNTGLGGLFDTCHNSFVNGKVVLEDIYTSDKSKWVSESARYAGGCNHQNSLGATTTCDCKVTDGEGIWPRYCGPTGYHDYEARRYLPRLNYPEALTPSKDKLEGFSGGGKFPFDYEQRGNITGITMGFMKLFHQFMYVGVNYTSGQRLVTPDYAKTYELAHQFDGDSVTWCDVRLGPGQLITGAVGVHDMAAVYLTPNIETKVPDKSFILRGITYMVSNVNETDWTVTPAFNVTCGDAPGSPSVSPDAVQAGKDKTFIPSAPEGGYGLIDNNLVLSVDTGSDAWLCHLDVLGINGDEVTPDLRNQITGFKFSWCWGELQLPGPQDWEECIRNGGSTTCSPDIPDPPPASPTPPPASPSPPPAQPPASPSPAPPPSDCTAVNWQLCPTPVTTNSSRYCINDKQFPCTCYTSERQVSGCNVPACYDPTQYNCVNTTKILGYQTLSPCTGDACPGKCTITAGKPWDNDCRPQVGR
ncbi:hypothetical protein OEZ85_013638 [Tetradesmus obliquus]|uniref:Uncharacterized protein n=1 Tax=Tetradesmus obliquus TaxID=3088 RepID=A0ABY8URI4_TETOB|nr:hypothetical protein OEZ85_013638 [Tetradesmus obliquus]